MANLTPAFSRLQLLRAFSALTTLAGVGTISLPAFAGGQHDAPGVGGGVGAFAGATAFGGGRASIGNMPGMPHMQAFGSGGGVGNAGAITGGQVSMPGSGTIPLVIFGTNGYQNGVMANINGRPAVGQMGGRTLSGSQAVTPGGQILNYQNGGWTPSDRSWGGRGTTPKSGHGDIDYNGTRYHIEYDGGLARVSAQGGNAIAAVTPGLTENSASVFVRQSQTSSSQQSIEVQVTKNREFGLATLAFFGGMPAVNNGTVVLYYPRPETPQPPPSKPPARKVVKKIVQACKDCTCELLEVTKQLLSETRWGNDLKVWQIQHPDSTEIPQELLDRRPPPLPVAAVLPQAPQEAIPLPPPPPAAELVQPVAAPPAAEPPLLAPPAYVPPPPAPAPPVVQTNASVSPFLPAIFAEKAILPDGQTKQVSGGSGRYKISYVEVGLGDNEKTTVATIEKGGVTTSVLPDGFVTRSDGVKGQLSGKTVEVDGYSMTGKPAAEQMKIATDMAIAVRAALMAANDKAVFDPKIAGPGFKIVWTARQETKQANAGSLTPRLASAGDSTKPTTNIANDWRAGSQTVQTAVAVPGQRHNVSFGPVGNYGMATPRLAA